MVCDPRECDQIPNPEEQEGRAESRSLVRTVMLTQSAEHREGGRRGEKRRDSERAREKEIA